MLGHELAVEEREIADLKPGHEPGQRHLRRIAGAAEHALAEEGAPELHTIKASDELAAQAHFDRMGVTRLVERKHRPLELTVDPGLLAVRAGGDDRCKILVVGHVETP